jgi:hypothetical protein
MNVTNFTTVEFVLFIQDLPYNSRVCSVHTGLTLKHYNLFRSYRIYLTTSELNPNVVR